jgi:class 3 adenylate cyclase
VHMPWMALSHLQGEWQLPEQRRWYERLAERRMLVRHDSRGTGLSERRVSDFSLDARILDVEAVVERLNLAKFTLFGPLHTGPLAVAYAARYPERVSHLMLWCTYASGSDWAGSPLVETTRTLIGKDWQLFTDQAAHALATGWESSEFAHRLAALYREATTQEFFQAFIPEMDAVDVTPLLAQLSMPVLVLWRRLWTLLPVDVARRIVEHVPDSRLALLEGGGLFPCVGDMEAAVQAIDEFLSEGERRAKAAIQAPSGMTAILFADIAESTSLTELLGDAAFREKARDLDTTLRAAIRECSGTAIEGKLLGDGVLAVFTSARQAIEAALACARSGHDAGLPLHLGLHAGDVIREDNNVYGGAVNIASRISGLSAPGEVLVSETVRSLARTSAGVRFEDRGEQPLKGVAEPVRVWVVAVEGAISG